MEQSLQLIDTKGIQILVSRKNSNRAERDIGHIRNTLKKMSKDVEAGTPFTKLHHYYRLVI